MSILIESCTEYMYENLNNILESSDNSTPQSRKNIFEKIVTFFKKLWLWIKEVFMKILGKTKDRVDRLEERLKIENESSYNEISELYNMSSKFTKDEFMYIVKLKFSKVPDEDLDSIADEIKNKKEQYEEILKDISERVKSKKVIMRNKDDIFKLGEVVNINKLTLNSSKPSFDSYIGTLKQFQRLNINKNVSDEDYNKMAYLGQVAARYDVERATILINLVNEITNNTYKHYNL